MRRSERVDDLPDGVEPAAWVADSIMSEINAERTAKAYGRRHDPERRSVHPIAGLTISEGKQRDALLNGARRGDPKAIDELWRRYRLRLIPKENA